MTIFGRNPAAWIGIIVSCILAVVSVLTGQGVIGDALAGQITDGVNAIAQLLVLLAPVLTGVLIRSQVTPVASPQLPAGTILTVIAPGDRPNQRVTL
jgi:hypothetical protein